MPFLYVIKSVEYGSRYVGVSVDFMKRLTEHNDGRCRYTKGRRPWKIIHIEKFDTLSDARKREIFLKSGQGRKWLDENIK